MDKLSNSIVLIPARGGSKGIPGKNIKILNGKPLIAWSIEHAIEAALVDEVYVSTDCSEIKKIAEKHGAVVPFLRPERCSSDVASTESVVEHFLGWAATKNLEIDLLTLLQPTSPIRHPGRLDEAIKHLIDQKADSLVSVSKTHKFMWKDLTRPNASYDIFNRPRRQDINKNDEAFVENGSIYVTRAWVYHQLKNRLGGKICLFEMSSEESFEIDDPLDFELVKFLMSCHGDYK